MWLAMLFITLIGYSCLLCNSTYGCKYSAKLMIRVVGLVKSGRIWNVPGCVIYLSVIPNYNYYGQDY